MKRIVSIQDLSCVGKCSLTVALPIISAMGVETAVIPTAVLSNHTAFSDFTVKDLTSEIAPISSMIKKEGIAFDAIYTGYLSSSEQVAQVLNFLDDFGSDDCLIFTDPAMADNGVLYTGFDKSFVGEMAKLCARADIIVPNITEACMLLGIDYIADKYNEAVIRDILLGLCGLGCKISAVTGVSFDDKSVGVMAYDSRSGSYFQYYGSKINAVYHGTGDVFSSSLVGAIMNDVSIEEAFKIAVDYTCECVRETFEDKESRWYGVNFETAIPKLLKMIGK